MKENTYYLWKSHYTTENDYLKERDKFIRLGFHVVTFIEGPLKNDLHEVMRTIIKNHL